MCFIQILQQLLVPAQRSTIQELGTYLLKRVTASVSKEAAHAVPESMWLDDNIYAYLCIFFVELIKGLKLHICCEMF